MKNLSQIPESELIIVKYKEGMTEVIEAGEIASCIAYNEGYNLEFFTAVKDAVQINERELITTLTEMLGDDQYEDWAEDITGHWTSLRNFPLTGMGAPICLSCMT